MKSVEKCWYLSIVYFIENDASREVGEIRAVLEDGDWRMLDGKL